jgi:hypothetical protein
MKLKEENIDVSSLKTIDNQVNNTVFQNIDFSSRKF